MLVSRFGSELGVLAYSTLSIHRVQLSSLEGWNSKNNFILYSFYFIEVRRKNFAILYLFLIVNSYASAILIYLPMALVNKTTLYL